MTCEYINRSNRKLKKIFKQGIDEYINGFRHTQSRHHRTSGRKAPENLSDQDMKIVKDKEGERILSKSAQTPTSSPWRSKENESSEELADNMDRLATYGKSKATFVIGGSLGLSDAVLKRADEKLSFHG
ncbi:23S rRNA (pseudouridine(1915)-N(3))-methyltransferase RlmH [Bacillus licheniformis]|nr:23S rRNA (pseudouridine(1915)-N(3))-methyltransferase RlmH [Bacillus licheniformis]